MCNKLTTIIHKLQDRKQGHLLIYATQNWQFIYSYKQGHLLIYNIIMCSSYKPSFLKSLVCCEHSLHTIHFSLESRCKEHKTSYLSISLYLHYIHYQYYSLRLQFFAPFSIFDCLFTLFFLLTNFFSQSEASYNYTKNYLCQK